MTDEAFRSSLLPRPKELRLAPERLSPIVAGAGNG